MPLEHPLETPQAHVHVLACAGGIKGLNGDRSLALMIFRDIMFEGVLHTYTVCILPLKLVAHDHFYYDLCHPHLFTIYVAINSITLLVRTHKVQCPLSSK